MSTHRRHDDGFTLPEVLISIVVMSIILSVVALTIVTSLRVAPSVSDRADSSIVVQGITTFLPPDVDSTEPGKFDIAPTTASGCSGTEEGTNIVRLTWSEEFYGNVTNYVANYRYVNLGDHAIIKRYYCFGQFTLGSTSVANMSGPLSPTLPTVQLSDSNADGDTDELKLTVETLSGELVFIDAASKNPAETLPPNVTNPTTTTTSTTTTTIANVAPNAAPTSWTVNPSTPTVATLNATDSDGTIVSSTIGSLPAGWTAVASGTTVTLTAVAAPGVYNLTYSVTDDDGATSNSTIAVTVSTTATTTTTTSTTTTTTTTSTTLPPCVVSGITVNPGSVKLKQKSSPSKLKDDVDVLVTVSGGYCVGLTLQYDTGAPSSQYVQNLGDAPPYDVTLLGNPHGTELWTTGSHTLQVRDGFNNLLATTTLTVLPS